MYVAKIKLQHNNPVRAGIVVKAEEFKNSSAAGYFHGKQKGRIKIERIDPLMISI